MDCQAIWPKQIVPKALQAIIPWYVSVSGDPLLGGVVGIHGNESAFAWLKSFIYLEAYASSPLP